jgi:L-threonylcarbamoyladenylate synthase
VDTKIYKPEELDEAAKQILSGNLVAFPTETVYGLGADATNTEAVGKVYAAKGRPSDNPLIVHVANSEQVKQYVSEFPTLAQELVDKFWPGPLTIILNLKETAFSSTVTGGLSTAAFRMPNNKVTLDFLNKTRVPLVGPSANTSGKPSPTTAQHVFHDLQGKIAGVIDDGPTQIGVESTVLDLSILGEATILRPGAITEEMLKDIFPDVTVDKALIAADVTPKAPGMKYTHYSPNADVYMMDEETPDWESAIAWANAEGKSVGLLADNSVVEKYGDEVSAVYNLTIAHSLQTATKNLFAGLRALDEIEPKVDVIFSETFATIGAGTAYMNRLSKAAGGKYFQK